MPAHKIILAWGAQTPVIAASASGIAQYDVSESGVSGRFILDNTVDGAVQLIRHRNKALTTGVVPASLFQTESQCNPRLRRFIQINDPLEVTILNLGAAALTANVGLTAAPMAGQAIPYEGDALREYTRDLIAWGFQEPTGVGCVDITAGTTVQFTCELLQAGRAGFLVVGSAPGTPVDGLALTEVTYDNVALLDTPTGVPANAFNDANPDNPLWGQILQVNHRLTVSVLNTTGTTIESVACCVTSG